MNDLRRSFIDAWKSQCRLSPPARQSNVPDSRSRSTKKTPAPSATPKPSTPSSRGAVEDLNAAPTPHDDGTDATVLLQAEEPEAHQVHFKSVRGGCRFIAYTTYPKTTYIVGFLATHLINPVECQMDALKRIVRYRGRTSCTQVSKTVAPPCPCASRHHATTTRLWALQHENQPPGFSSSLGSPSSTTHPRAKVVSPSPALRLCTSPQPIPRVRSSGSRTSSVPDASPPSLIHRRCASMTSRMAPDQATRS